MEGDQMKMREALDAALKFLGNLEIEPYSPLDEDASELRQRIMDALAAPPRQCDVGTAEEQYMRHDKFCDAARNRMSGYHCEDAPRCVFCFAKWAQTPYEAKEGAGK